MVALVGLRGRALGAGAGPVGAPPSWRGCRRCPPPLLAQLSQLAGDVWAWIEAQAPGFVERLTAEWGPAFVLWVAAVGPPLLLALGQLPGPAGPVGP